MCGIAGVHRLSDAPLPNVDGLASSLLTRIDSRGGHATGLGWVKDDGEAYVQKASCNAHRFNNHRRRVPGDVRTLILHTRYATQGAPEFPENNHPVISGPIHAVHNGHVWNDGEIFRGLSKRRRGEVDSEAIAALVWARGWGKLPALSEIDGDMAVAMFDKRKPGEFILARGNSSPVVFHRTGDLLIFASTAEALGGAWGANLGTPPKLKKLGVLKEGEALIVRDGEITRERFTPGYSYTRSWKKDDKDVTHGSARPYSPSTAATWREGTHGGGYVYTGASSDGATSKLKATALDLLSEVERDEDDVSDIVKEEDGIDTMRCDDCMDWFPVDELDTVGLGTFSNVLCEECKAWAMRSGLTVTDAH